ncbi:MAG TPA: hypothetical protein VL742_11910 [Casimicrobiaceae bacterium]|nr:hypothetical protein [Casimicrobiaceae bacterium]
MDRSQLNDRAIEPGNDRNFGAAKFAGPLGDEIEHRLGIGPRPAYQAQDLARRGLLRKRFGA